MALTKKGIIKMLNLDEPDYQSIAAKFSEEDIPLIVELTKDPDVSISSKAICILGWLDSDKAIEGIENGVKSENPILRISAAQALKRKSEKTDAEETSIGDMIKPLAFVEKSDKITQLLNTLLDDNDIGVKKFSLKAINPGNSKKFEAKLKYLQENEKNESIKKITNDIIKHSEK